MQKFLDNIPFRSDEYSLTIRGRRLVIPPFALVVSVSLTARGLAKFPRGAPIFPAKIDTGYSHNFAISESHLSDWMQGNISDFPFHATLPFIFADGGTQKLPLHDADLWVHADPNGSKSHPLELSGGFAYFAAKGPILPLLGACALHTTGLELSVDYRNLQFSIGQSGLAPGSAPASGVADAVDLVLRELEPGEAKRLIVEAVAQQPGLGYEELADRLRLDLETVVEHCQRLVEEGRIKPRG